ncbi:MAG: hypothetical protein DWQ31_11650 [Planctomycetota bacterium]|nr:MAG: hypothetical protein DWQ31_11650 [Planctomycetota bacterium]REJ96953.1 MAG: hypothetical protein DWQ35_03115 [Planctomycetota bacterium]REK26390.1 MAG: hypothetical protein DWQ42_09210 [Planctomycetota bacterium]REK37939.1 MAG: hypothetical protein DWQ46_21390 [Planctomycetota bacterium]
MFKKSSILAALAVIALVAFAAPAAHAADNVAMTKIVNTSDIEIGFDYRIGGGAWHSVRLAPGQSYGIWAGFTFPGSYVHSPIEIRFDGDLRPGMNTWRSFLPLVRYNSYVDWNRAQTYYFTYDGPSRMFLAMFPG